MNTKLLIAATAALTISITSIAKAEPQAEVLHWWTSGGEAKSVAVLQEEFSSRGGTWTDMPVAGGGGDAAMTAKRWKIPYRAATLMINQVLRDVNRDDLYISKTTLENWANKIGEEAVEEYEKEHQCLTCIKFDGKKSKRALGHNKFERQHFLTIIKEGFETPDPKYIDHKEAGETGLAMGGVVMKVIEETNSTDSLLAIGSGETLMLFFIFLNSI